MLTDLGKLSDEKLKAYQQSEADRLVTILGGGNIGCIGALPCKSCNHLISDSICLCSRYFVCPNCGTENKPESQVIEVSAEYFKDLSKQIL